MKTASFFTYSGAGRISIARSAPRKIEPGFKIFRALAPGPWFKSVEIDEYRLLYSHQLDALDPQQTWNDLHVLSRGAEPVLLCWERVERREFCHRRLVAEWFARTLGLEVPELGVPEGTNLATIAARQLPLSLEYPAHTAEQT